MSYDEDQDGTTEDGIMAATNDEQDEGSGADEDFGDDFDEFEAGAGDDDFGDFDEGFQEISEQERPEPQKPPAPVPESPFVSSYTLTIALPYISSNHPFTFQRTPADPSML